jgi:hypothetical protein
MVTPGFEQSNPTGEWIASLSPPQLGRGANLHAAMQIAACSRRCKRLMKDR